MLFYTTVTTVSCKTVPMFGTFVVYTIFCLSAWESRLALREHVMYRLLATNISSDHVIWLRGCEEYAHFKQRYYWNGFANF